ncbi:MAG: Spy/CpxP family protein refolding chaperone [Gammaproteobacteria bacterium WSBS_2016_MAG_OTU1]
MKNQLIKKISLIIAVIAVSGGLIAAVGAGHRHNDRYERIADHVADKLSFNDEQEEKLEDILEAVGEKRKQLRDGAKEEINNILTQDKISKENAMKIMRLRKTQKEAMHDYIAEQLVEFHAMLTPKQRKRFAKLAPRMLKSLLGDKKRHGKKGYRDSHDGKHHDEHDDDDDDEHHDEHDDDDEREHSHGHDHDDGDESH